MNAHVSFCYVWKTLEKKLTPRHMSLTTLSLWHFQSLSLLMRMKELVIVKDLSYSDVSNMLQDKNTDVTRISERSVRRFCTSNNIRKRSDLYKEEFQKIIFLEASKV